MYGVLKNYVSLIAIKWAKIMKLFSTFFLSSASFSGDFGTLLKKRFTSIPSSVPIILSVV